MLLNHILLDAFHHKYSRVFGIILIALLSTLSSISSYSYSIYCTGPFQGVKIRIEACALGGQ